MCKWLLYMKKPEEIWIFPNKCKRNCAIHSLGFGFNNPFPQFTQRKQVWLREFLIVSCTLIIEAPSFSFKCVFIAFVKLHRLFIYDYVWLGFFPQQAGRRPEELSSLADVRWFPNRICDEFQIPLCKKNISSFHEFALIFAVSLHSHCFLLRYMGLLCLIKSLTTKGRSRWRTFMAPTPVCRSPGKKKRGRAAPFLRVR